MFDQKTLTICAAERLHTVLDGDFVDSWHHSFLLLLDETNGQGVDAKVLQQLHFNNEKQKVLPVVRPGLAYPSQIHEFDLCPYVSGAEQEILARWVHGLRFALDVRSSGVAFSRNFKISPNAINCRAGTKSALHVMGLGFVAEFSKSAAGTKGEIDTGFKAFDETQKQPPVHVLRAQSAELAAQLPSTIKRILDRPTLEAG